MSHLTFTLIQTNLHWEDKAANLQMLEDDRAFFPPYDAVPVFNAATQMRPVPTA